MLWISAQQFVLWWISFRDGHILNYPPFSQINTLQPQQLAPSGGGLEKNEIFLRHHQSASPHPCNHFSLHVEFSSSTFFHWMGGIVMRLIICWSCKSLERYFTWDGIVSLHSYRIDLSEMFPYDKYVIPSYHLFPIIWSPNT